MSVIAKLDILVQGNTGNLDQALNKANQNLGKFKTDVDKHGKSIEGRIGSLGRNVGGKLAGFGGAGWASGLMSAIGKLGPAVAALGPEVAIAGAAFAALAVSVTGAAAAMIGLGLANMTSVEGIGKMAGKLGMSTEMVSAYQHAIAKSGGDVDTLNTNLTKFVKNLSGADDGAAEMNKAFNELGLSAQELASMKTDDALMKVADAFKTVGSEGDKVRLSMELFGKSGTAMLGVMKSGSDGVKAALQEASDMGLTVTMAETQSVAEADRAWRNMKESIVGLGRTMAIAIAPAVEFVSKQLSRFFSWINSWRDQIKYAFAYIYVVFDHFGEYCEIVNNRATLVWYQFAFGLIHLFTDTIPKSFVAFSGFVATWLSNLVDNVTHNFSELWNYITSAGEEGGKFAWKPLTEGWKQAWKQIKDSAVRQETDLEKDVRKKIAQGELKLGADIDAYLNRKAKEVAKGTAINGQGGKNPKAVEAGSQEAFAIIANAQGDKMYEALNAQLQENKKMVDLLDKIARQQKGENIRKAKL